MTEVLVLIAEGLPLKEIAQKLNLSRKTIEFHWERLRVLLGFRSYVDACKYALRNKLITL